MSTKYSLSPQYLNLSETVPRIVNSMVIHIQMILLSLQESCLPNECVHWNRA